jgi:hypothetical protein
MFFVLPFVGFGCVENFILGIRDKNAGQDDMADTGLEVDDNPEPSDTPNPEPDTDPVIEPDDSPEPSSEPDDIPDPDQPGDSATNPKSPSVGDVLVNELMIDPDAVTDKNGEWIELYNISDDWIDLSGLSIVDLNKDDYEIEGVAANSLIIPPSGYLMICANGDFWANGGVNCQATFFSNCFGSGFCLANGEDEVILVSSSYVVIDYVFYSSGFSTVGASMGVSPSSASYDGNDDLSNWCEQWGILPQLDAGSPGEMNDICF